LGNSRVRKRCDRCTPLTGGAALCEHAFIQRRAVIGVQHCKRADRLTRAEQTPIGTACGQGIGRIAYPRYYRIELAVELGHQHLASGQRRRSGDQQGGERDKRRHPDDKLVPQRVAAGKIRPRHNA
jgi:hypothetical protein